MFRPVSIYIGLRYTRAKRRNQFISLISLISMLGIALGVMVLITVLSVLNGFDKEIKKQIFGMISPITISHYAGRIEHWEDIQESLNTTTSLTGIAPFIMGQGLLTYSGETQPAMINGIIPAAEKAVSNLDNKFLKGHLANLKPGHFGIVIGEDLASHLGVKLADKITVATPQASFSSTQMTPRFRQFTIVGIFQAGGGSFGFDSKLAFIHLRDAQTFFNLGSAITAFRININDVYQAPLISQTLLNQLPIDMRVTNWTQQLGEFFENIRLTKTMMFFIFVLIIAVAVFNLIATMVMIVKNKQSDIAILRTLGATPATILAIFVVQGLAISLGGTLLGIIGGIVLSWRITALTAWIQTFFHVQLVSSKVYFVNFLPAELQWSDVWIIGLIALALSLLATLYPAWNASRVQPVEALRYD